VWIWNKNMFIHPFRFRFYTANDDSTNGRAVVTGGCKKELVEKRRFDDRKKKHFTFTPFHCTGRALKLRALVTKQSA